MADHAAQYQVKVETVLRVAGAVLLMGGLGTLYSFSVFVSHLEPQYGDRTAISGIFSAAVFFFAVGMLVGPRFNLPDGGAAMSIGALAAGGIALAGTGHSYWTILIGFGVLFGLANGLGYSLSLKLVQAAPAARTGTLTGVAVASYMLGSILGAPLLAASLSSFGFGATFAMLAGSLLSIGATAFVLLRAAGHSNAGAEETGSKTTWPDGRDYAKLWTCFFFSSIAGVTALGHAAPIVASFGGTDRIGVVAASLCALGNGAGRLAGGWLCDRSTGGTVLGAASAVILTAAVAMLAAPTTPIALIGLAAIGIGYGCIASALPSAIANTYGVASVGRIFGRLFTAWGAAGLFGPFAAGWLFELAGDYRPALVATATAGAIAMLAGRSFRPLPA
jgi:OFA family oxalate/formate antiporter-like MFS transporter